MQQLGPPQCHRLDLTPVFVVDNGRSSSNLTLEVPKIGRVNPEQAL
jgi:hypothetical protein